MYPKLRRPFVSWLLTVFTGGIYFLFWVWNIANEVNSSENRIVFPVKQWRIITLTLYMLAAVGIVITKMTSSPLFFFGVAIFLLGYFLYVQISIGNYIKKKDVELITGKEFSNTLSIFLFWMVANIGVAYMQFGINRIIRCDRARS